MKQNGNIEIDKKAPWLLIILGKILWVCQEIIILLFKILLWSVRKLNKYSMQFYSGIISPRLERANEYIYLRACKVFDCEKEIN